MNAAIASAAALASSSTASRLRTHTGDLQPRHTSVVPGLLRLPMASAARDVRRRRGDLGLSHRVRARLIVRGEEGVAVMRELTMKGSQATPPDTAERSGGDVITERPPLPYPAVLSAEISCVTATARLLRQRRIYLSPSPAWSRSCG